MRNSAAIKRIVKKTHHISKYVLHHAHRDMLWHVWTKLIVSLTKRWGLADLQRQRSLSRWTSCPPAGWPRCVSRPGCVWTGCCCWREPGRWRWWRSASVTSNWLSASGSQRWGPTTPRHRTRPSSTWEDAPGPRAHQVCVCVYLSNNNLNETEQRAA